MSTTDLMQRVAQLTAEQRILLQERLQAAHKSGSHQQIQRRTDMGPAPLSFSQERLWFLAQLEPESTAYNETSVYRLSGRLKLSALERGLDALSARHDCLRVCFREMGGSVVQIAEPLPPTRVNSIDLKDFPENEQMDLAWQKIDAAQSLPFDLTVSPLWRVFLICMADDDYLLVRITHHIISDGWSNGIFWRELQHFYAAYATSSEPSPLPELPISYADFSVWQREQLQGDRLTELVDFWREKIAGVEPLNLPTDHPRPTQPSRKGAMIRFQVSRALSRSLSSLARTSGVTLYMLLLTAFQILLHRYTGQTDIAVGSPIANRTRPELEGIYGFFVNTLVMRANCRDNPPFRSLLAQVRENALEAYRRQELPFEKLVAELHPVRDLSRNPIFDVTFALQNIPRASIELQGALLQRLERPQTTCKFDLGLSLYERDEQLHGGLAYATDLFEESTIKRMVGHFQTLLGAIVEDPDCLIGSLALLTQAERLQLLVDWNAATASDPSDASIHQIFEVQAARTPDAVAISAGNRQISYRQVEEEANRLAHYLLSHGVQPGDIVGLYLERSTDAIVAMLAILKVGAVYLPLDLATPASRLEGMARQANLRLIVSDRDQIPGFHMEDLQIVSIGRWRAERINHPTQPPSVARASNDPAYLIFTSGSTGVPKGVLISHQAVISLVRNTDYVDLTASTVVAHAANLAFDAATFEVWGALLNGATCAILSKETVLSAPSLAQALQQHAVTTLFLTTALFNQLINQEPSLFAGLDNLLFGGEAVSPQHVVACMAAGAPRRLLHVYGPTETTTFATWHLVNQLEADAHCVPIGRPLANKQAYILDRYLQPVPIGITGELYIGGVGLALGYLNQPEQTAERFVPHPFSSEAGARLYRTGDLARHRQDGAIIFMGRIDRQVKIRGFRIEPGEVEAALRAHPAIRDGLVDVVEDGPLGRRLVAWWVARHGAAPHDDDLRAFLRSHLPDVMIPSALVQVDELPLTANGKIDRQRLPDPEPLRTQSATESPQTVLETQLLGIWQRVLGQPNLGIDDDFFDVGGHSLLALHLLTQVADATGQELPVASLFHKSTVRQQASLLEQHGWSPPWRSLVPVQPDGDRLPLFLVPPAGASSIRFAAFAHFLGSDQPLYSFDPIGLNEDNVYGTVEETAAHYIDELRQIQPHGPYLLGGMCYGAHIAFEMARQLQANNLPVLALYNFDAPSPLNGPTWSRQPVRRDLRYFIRRSWRQLRRKNLRLALRIFLEDRVRRALRRFRRSGRPRRAEYHTVKRAQERALIAYRPEPISSPIIVFQSEQFGRLLADKMVRWSELSTKNVDFVTFPGATHFSLLLEDDHIQTIAERLRQSIDTVMDRSAIGDRGPDTREMPAL